MSRLAGNESVLKLLLKLNDVNSDRPDGSCQTPLLMASMHAVRKILALQLQPPLSLPGLTSGRNLLAFLLYTHGLHAHSFHRCFYIRYMPTINTRPVLSPKVASVSLPSRGYSPIFEFVLSMGRSAFLSPKSFLLIVFATLLRCAGSRYCFGRIN